MIALRTIDAYNFGKILRLKLKPGQEDFVASNAFSLSEAYVKPECHPLAIYDGLTPVGFAMYALDCDDKEYWIYRLMIDADYQGRGYGREAMRLLIAHIRREAPERKVLYISFEPENTVARHLYESMGFIPDNRMEDGELVYRLDLTEEQSHA